MRNLLLSVFIFLAGAAFAQDKYLSFSSGYVNSGKFKATKTVTQGDSYIDVTYKFTGAYMYNQQMNGKSYMKVEIPEAFYLCQKGDPALPFFSDMLTIKSSENVSVTVTSSSYKEYSVSNTLVPALGPSIVSKELPAVEESEVYSKSSLYPSSIAELSNVSSFKSVPIATVAVYPVRYNPSTKKVRCYTSITYRLKYKNVDVSKSLKAKEESVEFLKSVLSNPAALDQFGSSNPSLTNTDAKNNSSIYDYVIVTTPKYSAAAKKLSDWKNITGLRCTTLCKSWETDSEVNTALRNLYDSQYSSYSKYPDYVTIIGDLEDVPATYTYVEFPDRLDPNERKIYFYTDFFFANTDEQYFNVEIAKGRLSVSTQEEAMNFVNKIINYEKKPTTDPDFYNKAVLTTVFEDEQIYNNNKLIQDYNGRENNYFCYSSEYLYDKFTSVNYNVDRVYTRTKASTYCPSKFGNGSSLPNDLYGCKDIWNGTSADLVNSINDGRSLAIYNGHGNYQGWWNIGFNVNSVKSLKNGDKLPVMFGFCCQSGMFNIPVCFTEAVTRKADGGAVGAAGFSQYGWTIFQDYMAQGTGMALFDNIDNERHYAVGDIIEISKRYLLNAYNSSNKNYIMYMYGVSHYFGDPSMEIWTNEPMCLTPTITRSGTSITVNTNGVKNCKVTLCSISGMGDEYYNTYTFTGSETSHTFTNVSKSCYVTVRKHNYIPYVGVSYIQNVTITDNMSLKGKDIYAGKNVASSLTQGNVVIKSGATSLTASSSIHMKKGFYVNKGAKFSAKKQADDCDYNGTESELRSKTIYKEFEPDLTDVDDALSENVEDNIIMYPNPTDGALYIRCNDEQSIQDVTVMNADGSVMIEKIGDGSEMELNLTLLKRGIYFVKVVTDEGTAVKKVVLK